MVGQILVLRYKIHIYICSMKAKLYIYKFKTTPGSRSHYFHFTDEEIRHRDVSLPKLLIAQLGRSRAGI